MFKYVNMLLNTFKVVTNTTRMCTKMTTIQHVMYNLNTTIKKTTTFYSPGVCVDLFSFTEKNRMLYQNFLHWVSKVWILQYVLLLQQTQEYPGETPLTQRTCKFHLSPVERLWDVQQVSSAAAPYNLQNLKDLDLSEGYHRKPSGVQWVISECSCHSVVFNDFVIIITWKVGWEGVCCSRRLHGVLAHEPPRS